MSLALLWLLAGGASALLKRYLINRYGPLVDSQTKKKRWRRELLMGILFGPLHAFSIPEGLADAIKDRKALLGPGGKDSIQDCLHLRDNIRLRLQAADECIAKRQALLGGAQHLLEEDFSAEASRRAGLHPRSEQMPDSRDLRRVCQELRELSLHREALQEGLTLTEERIDAWRCEFEGQIEAMEMDPETLRPNAALLRPPDSQSPQPTPAPTLPEPKPEPPPDPNQLMLERLGTVSDEVKRRIWGTVKWQLKDVKDGRGGRHQWTRMVYLATAYLDQATNRAFRKERGLIASWIATEIGDHKLGLAVSEAHTAKEAQELIKWRLKQTEEFNEG